MIDIYVLKLFSRVQQVVLFLVANCSPNVVKYSLFIWVVESSNSSSPPIMDGGSGSVCLAEMIMLQ